MLGKREVDMEVDRRSIAAARGHWDFCGRRSQLEDGRRALIEQRGVIVFGETGVGKSRLAEVLVADAAPPGTVWHSVTASEGTAHVPLGAWAHLLPPGWTGRGDEAATWQLLSHHLAPPAGDIHLVVDDAHWLDPVSAGLLHHLVAGGKAKAVVTSRGDGRVSRSVRALWKDRYLGRIDLEPFHLHETEAVLEAALGAPVEPQTLLRLHERSGGDLNILRELVDAGRAGETLRLLHGAWVGLPGEQLSPRLADLLADRVGDLDADERAGVEVLTVAGPLPVELLARAVTPSIVERLAARRFLRFDGERARRVARLADPLVGEAVLDDMDDARRDALLRSLVEIYESGGGTEQRDDVKVCIWRIEAGLPVDDGRVLHAADWALAHHDFAAAELLAAAAIEAGAGDQARVRLGEAVVKQQRHREAESVLVLIDERLHDLDATTRFRYAVARALALSTEMGRLDDAVAVLETVIATLPEGQNRRSLEAQLSLLLADAGRLRAAAPLAEKLIAFASTDEVSALTALVATGVIDTLSGRCRDTLDLCDRMTPLALDHLADVPEAIGWIGAAQMLAHYVDGDLNVAEEFAHTMEAVVGTSRDATLRAAVLMYLGLVLTDKGQLDSALRVLRQAAALHEVDNRRGYQSWCFAITSRAHAQQGDLVAAQAALAAARRTLWPGGQNFAADLDVAETWVATLAGDHTGAERLLDGAIARAAAEGMSAVVAHLRHEGVRAGLDPAVHAPAIAAIATVDQSRRTGAQARHALALAADDGAGLGAAARELAALGFRLQAAEAFAESARAHRRAGSTTMAIQAKELGRIERAACDAARTPALRFDEMLVGLTSRELDVVQRAAIGQANQVIADGLDISVRTVETHLHRSFSKLGINDRRDLKALFGPA